MEIFGTAERDILRTATGQDTVYGYGGNDQLFNDADGGTLVGGDGNDEYRLFSHEATIIEEVDGGHDTLWAWNSVTLPDNVEDLLFKGVSGWNALRGNDLANNITSGAGDQALRGGGGDDTLTGGAGIDSFTFEAGEGHDLITDFTPGEDVLAIWLDSISSFNDFQAHAVQTDAGTLITLAVDQSILLEGVLLSDLSARDVLADGLPQGFLDNAVLTFEDTFDDLSTLSDGTWNTQPSSGHPVIAAQAGNNRYHTYIDENSTFPDGTPYGITPFSVDDGILSITAQRTPDALQNDVPEDWVSGVLETHGLFSQTYGYFEVRAKIPAGQAYWPAFWLLPDDYSWPPEVDLLETQGSDPDIYRAAVHSRLLGAKVTSAYSQLVPDLSADFHTYGVLWTPETVSFTLDGRVMFETETPHDMHDPMALQLNLAIGGWLGGPDESTPDGGSFQIDYVRAYQIPGIETIERSTDSSAYGDVDAGILNTSQFGRLNLYGDSILQVQGSASAELSLPSGATGALLGNVGNDTLVGNDAGTALNGDEGHDVLYAGAGDDYLIGGAGNDTLDGGLGDDTLIGGEGDDTYVFRRGDGSLTPAFDLILEEQDEGTDTIVLADLLPEDINSYIDWARWYIVAETNGTPEYFAIKVTPTPDGHVLGNHIERLVFADGTEWDLTGGIAFLADDEANSSSGTAFDDTMTGGGGDDTMAGMAGDDIMDGGAGIDQIYGWSGDDMITDSGAEGGDLLSGEAGNDTLRGGAGTDTLLGGTGEDLLRANEDGDILDGGADDDRLWGAEGVDELDGGLGDDSLQGFGGADALLGGEGRDTLRGGAGDDTISGEAGDDRAAGGEGQDSLLGGSGADTLDGDAGADTLDGGAGQDLYRGGAGVDVFRLAFEEIEGDTLQDYEVGERVEVLMAPDAGVVTAEVQKNKILLTREDDEETAMFFAVGFQLDDLVFV